MSTRAQLCSGTEFVARGVLSLLVGTSLAACAVDSAEVDQETTRRTSEALTFNQRLVVCQNDPRVVANVVDLQVCVGADIFFRETFDGNGRTCASCHRVENNFTIDPPFIATLPPSDPLFVAEFNPALANLERSQQLRASSLILENVDGVEPDPNVRFVLRSVPHNFSMETSITRGPGDPVVPPVHRTGWSGDGAPGQGALRDFTTGAIVQHATRRLDRVAGVDFRLADSDELDAVDLFMRRVGRTNELHLPSTTMSDGRAELGRQVFLSPEARCNGCHENAGANANFGGGGNRNFNTGVESARSAALAGFPIDGGFLAEPVNPDGSFGTGEFNSTPLVEAADTGPFFHTDTTVSGASAHNTPVATTIEQAIAFYDTPAFNDSPSGQVGPIDLTANQINDLGRFLRVVNASFNAHLTLKRLDGALELVNHFQNQHLAIQQQLLVLARVELDDAIAVLDGAQGGGLNVAQRQLFEQARGFINAAISAGSSAARQSNISQSRSRVWDGITGLGQGLHFQIGDGTVMF